MEFLQIFGGTNNFQRIEVIKLLVKLLLLNYFNISGNSLSLNTYIKRTLFMVVRLQTESLAVVCKITQISKELLV